MSSTATAAKEKAMATFTIDSENNITGYAPGAAIPAGRSERFTTAGELAALTEQWPAGRFVEVWNSIPGLTPVKKFTSRKTAIARIWRAAQSLMSGPNAPDVATKPAKSSKRPTPKAKAHTARKNQQESRYHSAARTGQGGDVGRPHERNRLAGPQRARVHFRHRSASG